MLCPKIDLPHPPVSSPKTHRRLYGWAFQMQPRGWWEGHYDQAAVLRHLDHLPGPGSSGFNLGVVERRVLKLLARWTWADGLAAPVAVARELGMSRQAVQRITERLGVCRLVVNVGGYRRQDLRVNPDVLAWDMGLLQRLRAARAQRVHREVPGCGTDAESQAPGCGIPKLAVVECGNSTTLPPAAGCGIRQPRVVHYDPRSIEEKKIMIRSYEVTPDPRIPTPPVPTVPWGGSEYLAPPGRYCRGSSREGVS